MLVIFYIRGNYIVIPLEQYRVFAAVARNKSFCRAAEELFITQPAVSQSVKQLEDELGVQLFVRSSRGVSMTQAGEELFGYVEQALRLFAGAESHLSELKQLEGGTLNIGASDTLCRQYLLPQLKCFHSRYPHVNLRVTNRTSLETVELVKQGRADIGYINLPTDTGRHITVCPLEELHDCFVCRAEAFPQYTGRTLGLSELEGAPLLMLEGASSTRRYLDACAGERGISLHPQIELGSHELLLSFAEIGLGVAAVVREYSQEYISSGRLTEIVLSDPVPPRAVALIYHEKLPLPLSAREFIQMSSRLSASENV